MKAKISRKGEAFLKSTQASRALVAAVVNHSEQLSRGEAVPFTVSVHVGDRTEEREVFVRKVTSL